MLCLFIAPDITISRMARGERKAVLRLVALVSICMLWFGKPHQWWWGFLTWFKLKPLNNGFKYREVVVPALSGCHSHTLSVLMPLQQMQIADVYTFPSNSTLDSCWVLNLQVGEGSGKETPELSVSLCEVWGGGEGSASGLGLSPASAPLLLILSCSTVIANGLPIQN